MEHDAKRQVWRKFHLVVDTDTHEITAAQMKLSGVTNAEVLLPTIYPNKHAKLSKRSWEMTPKIQGNTIEI